VGAQAKVYFSAFLGQGGTGIERAGFDGGGLETLQFEPAGFADDLALDTLDGKTYWTDTNASVIWSANLNGTDAQIVLDDFGQEPLGIALDVAGGEMYWTDAQGVKRAALDGTKQELLTKGPARGFIALDLLARQMYWADWPSGDIKTAPMTLEPTVTNVVTKQSCPFGIAVDHGGGKVYWLDLEINEKKKCEKKDEILRANLDGSNVQPLLERPGAGFEGGFVIDPAAEKLYWSETAAHDIGVSNLDGSQAQTLFSTGEDSPEGLAVETANPHPANTAAPFIEGNAQVGNPLSCNPGTWTGTGAVFFGYQWAVVGATAIEGATASTYVPPAEQAGSMLNCVVTAADNVETSAATSAAVTVAPFPSGPAPPPLTVVQTRLLAGIALARLTASGTKARVPVFTSLPGTATLKATPIRKPHKPTARARSKPPVKARAVTVTQSLRAGRNTITLRKLVPGTTYRLLLTITSVDGQTTRDTATLKVTKY
jgi:Low-density lipoprotein receptor repeat class B